jgi:alanine racemase
VPISHALVESGVEWLAVATVDEGCELREAGIDVPVLVLTGIPGEHVVEAVKHCLTAVVWDVDGAERLAAALPSHKRLTVHLKIDTGMHRVGAMEADLPKLAAALRRLPLDVEAVFSHLACAEDPDDPSLASQEAAFHRAVETLAQLGVTPRLKHLANSAGLLAGPRLHLDLVRPGIMLYGGLPDPRHAAQVSLRPVMRFSSRILQAKTIDAGASVGYGHTFVTRRKTRIAIAPVGYAHGYPRALSNRGEVLVRRQRAPVVGLVSMNHVTIDVTDVVRVSVGDEVVLWGAQGNDTIDVMEMGVRAGTIGYELLTGVGRSMPRVYREANSRKRTG